MKKIITSVFPALAVTALLFMNSCYDDKGNYTYIDENQVMPVTIEDMESRSILMFDPLKVEPVVSGLDNPADYNIAWYVTTPYFVDTLSTALILDIESVSYPVGNYTMNLSIERKSNSVKAFGSFGFEVTTSFFGGWFILKEDAGMTDVDFLLTDGTIRPDLLSGSGRLVGKPRNIVSQGVQYGHTFYPEGEEPEPVFNLPVFHVTSESDVRTYQASDFTLLKTADDFFYLKPDVIDINNITFFSGALHLINDGKFHGLWTQVIDYQGRMGSYKPLDYDGQSVSNYQLSDFLIRMSGPTALGFETVTRSFVYSTSSGTTARTVSNPVEGHPARDLEYDLVNWTVGKTGHPQEAFMLMKHISDPHYVIFKVVCNTSTPVREVIRIPDDCGLISARVIGADASNSNIYFSKGDNVLWNHVVAENPPVRESVLYTFGNDEVVTFINYDQSSRLFSVLVSTPANKWKLYCFKRENDTPSLPAKPVYVFEGTEGTGHQLLPMSVPVPE